VFAAETVAFLLLTTSRAPGCNCDISDPGLQHRFGVGTWVALEVNPTLRNCSIRKGDRKYQALLKNRSIRASMNSTGTLCANMSDTTLLDNLG
jgi:hypothetical protein